MTLHCSRKRPLTGPSAPARFAAGFTCVGRRQSASPVPAMTTALSWQQGTGGTAERGDNGKREQILLSSSLETENSFGSFAAACSGSHYLVGAHPHFKHTQLHPQMIYFNINLKDESMQQSQKFLIAAISGSSACTAISI